LCLWPIALNASVKWILRKPVEGDVVVELQSLPLFQDFSICDVFETREAGARFQAIPENPIQVFN
jgi:hypothetical protein